ncbi:hypothetical protein F5J12DRAFT_788575 [Pisolithus orientalis]|uniref:uncharacterized protein n=1 Tax=Pisolithus orientalis TaxID=936130 RepID=UPI0022256983|nr:uncharacterized protein F5J12DRAFT_788575 [Pisolithus orientalis]KAI5981590.1 hypothetical protein F5J12DRAFT_788575 [Pisolithus orientalis]
MSAKQSHQVHFNHQGEVVFIVGSSDLSHPQLISCVKQSKNLEEMLVQLHELQEPTPPPIVSSGRADMVGLNMDITANSCESLLDQFLQAREPTALAEGRIAAIIDPHDNLMNWFLNEWEQTAPPVDGMNMDLLKQLLNVQEPLALPVTHEKLNRMDRSSTPAQDITMQDMREPMPPPLISNVPVKSFDLAVDEDNGTNCLTFGMPEQSEMRDLFEEICNSELPSTQQSLQMEQWGLAPVPGCNQVSCYCGNTTPSDMPFNPTLDRNLVQGVNAIVRELGTAARDQYGAASQGLQLINMLDLMEVIHYLHSAFENCPEPFITSQSHPSHQSVVEMGILYLACQIEVASVHLKQTADIVGWPAHWFANLAMDLCCMPVILLPSQCATMGTSDTKMMSAIIPHWTPHTADPNSGFAFPWWLYCSEEYAADSQSLQGKGLFSTAWEFFKLMMAQGLWPLPEAPISDRLDGHIKEQVVGIAWVVGHAASIVYMFLTMELVVYTLL